MPYDSLWISWYPHRRTSSLCGFWNLNLTILRTGHSGFLRVVVLAWFTARIIAKERPSVLFVQNPSIGLVLTSLILRPIFRYVLVVDAHNEAVDPFVNDTWLVRKLSRQIIRRSCITVVTNEELACCVREIGGNAFIIPDPLPHPPNLSEQQSSANYPDKCDVFVVSTFAPDEPIREIVQAAGNLPSYRFFVSGRGDTFAAANTIPQNVTLTGFLSDTEYWQSLKQAKVVCDLTLMPNCLVCGAYEALALRKAMILSDNPAGRRLFSGAAVFTAPDPDAITQSIEKALISREMLESEASRIADRYVLDWRKNAESLIEGIGVMMMGH